MHKLWRAGALTTLGLAGWAGTADAAFTDLKFGQYQVADSQWGGPPNCITADTCSVTDAIPGTAYNYPGADNGGTIMWGEGDYLAFVANPASETNATYPYSVVHYDANGAMIENMGLVRISTIGTTDNGEILFFVVGTDNFTGQLFSGNKGLSPSVTSYEFATTVAPDTSYLDGLSSQMSLIPLGEGEGVGETGGPDPEPVMENLSLLERVLATTNGLDAMQPLTGTFLNIAENVAVLDSGTGAILNRIDGSVTNTLEGITAATALVEGDVLAVEQVTVSIGTISTTVLGAVNTGEIGLGVNHDLNEAIAGSALAVSGRIVQLGGAANHAVLAANVASNATSVTGAVLNRFTGLNGAVGAVSTTVLGAVNTGTIVSGVNSAIYGVQGQIVGG
jgi:hypothetical protein